MIGFVAIFLALVATAVAIFCYLNAYLVSFSRSRKPRVSGGEQRGVLFYRLSAVCIVGASLYLYYIIFNNQFQYAYVFGHSSSDLNVIYKFSAFWAGQEGSFLLWALLHAGFGLLLPRKDYSGVMVVHSVVQSMLLVTLLAKSPFMMMVGVPPEGYGLNPLLQDPWMVIHPPLVFIGYAGLAVPFAYAIDG
ncbi:MAG: cytochrome c biogenesis protein CcsA, partial [Sporomusa sp.]